MTDYDTFTLAYLEAIAFTDLTNPDSDSAGAELAPETLERCAADCAAFQEAAAGLLALAFGHHGYGSVQAGHDFWLTRCGHGAGFWDRGLDDVGDKLTALVGHGTEWPNLDVYKGDDGLAYLA